jgi:ligand-binding sensor domain-containing protein
MDSLSKSFLAAIALFGCALCSANNEPAGYAYGIDQDKDGYVYQATQTGGFRFDGLNYVPLNTLFDLPSNWVKDLKYIPAQNHLLIAMGDLGVFQANLNTYTVNQLTKDTCWRFALADTTLVCSNAGEVTAFRYTGEQALATNLFNKKMEATAIVDGYVDSNLGLFQIIDEELSVIDSEPAKHSRLSTSENGLLVWRNGQLKFYDKHGKTKSIAWPDYPAVIKLDGNSALIESDGHLTRLSLFDFSVLESSVGITSKPFKYLFKDRDDALWLIGTNDIEILSDARKHLTPPVTSAYNLMLKTNYGTFLGTERGVYRLEDGKTSVIGEPAEYGYIVTDIKSVGTKLFIATSKGLTEYDFETKEFKRLYKGYVIVLAVVKDKLLVGTNDEGVYQYETDGSLQPVSYLNNIMMSQEVAGLAQLGSLLYIGTGNGFYTLDDRKYVKRFGDDIRTVVGFVKFKNKIYVATFGQGLFEFDGNELKRLDTPQSITALGASDDALYLGTLNGVYRMGDELTLFPNTDGLSVTANSLYIANNKLIFGSQFGVETFDTKETNKIPKLELAGVENSLGFFTALPTTLTAQDRTKLHFTAFEFEQDIMFEYKINEQWFEAKNGTVEFTNIAPGKYDLNLRVRYQDGQWQEKTFKLNFKGKWHQSYWFIGGLAFVLIVLTGIFVFANVVRSERRKAIAEEQYSGFTISPLHEALHWMLKAKACFDVPDVNKHADGLVCLDQSIDQLVPMAHGNAVLGKRSLEQGLQAIQASLQYEASDIDFQYFYSIAKTLQLTREIQQDIYAVVYHAVKNSVEHGKAKRIEIYVEQARDLLQVEIMDNGTGCSWFQRKFKFGLGIFVIEHVAAKNGAKSNIVSSKKGTQVRIGFRLTTDSYLADTRAQLKN